MSILGSTSSTGSSSSSASSLGTSQQSVQSQYQTFLTLLTTELQNQDPTEPLDSSQFTSQLAQFSSLEQQLQSNSYLQTLVANQAANGVSSSINYIGHTVEAAGDSFAVTGASGTTTPINFSLPSAASTATVSILNSSGATVNSFTIDNATAGTNSYSFGNTDSSGDALPAGTYTYSVSANDSSGNAITPTTYETGTVTGISTASDGTTVLNLGNSLTVPASSVVQVTG